MTHRSSQMTRILDGATEDRSSDIAIESEVRLSVNGELWLSFRCSPENLDSLAVGFLFNEGFIQSIDEVASLQICDEGDHVDVWLHHEVQKPESWSRTSGCQGGSTRTGQVQIPPLTDLQIYPVSGILKQVDYFLTELHKPDYPQRGVHSTMLFDNGEVRLVCNDIGRHNTLDKIAGDLLDEQIELEIPVIITTGRISSEMVNKIVRMKIPLAISLHSVSDLAVMEGDASGLTLIGHARRNKVDIYAHPERISART